MTEETRRIPLSLQAIFLASNRGQDVDVPPPGNLAIRMFQLMFHRPLRRRLFRHVKPMATNKEITTTIRSNSIASKKPMCVVDQQCDDEIEKSGSLVRVSSRRSDAMTAAGSVGSEKSNEDLFYCSPHAFKKKLRLKSLITPQSYLDAMLEERGYSTSRYYVHESGYYNSTTPLQQLSYHQYIIDLVKDNEVEELRSLFAAGLSTNPADVHGEGLVHLVCRIGAVDILKMMLDSGCDVQVSDDYGRTPLHDACWSAKPSFQLIELLLQTDPHMLYLMDVRGSCPLAYVPEQDYDAWIRFFQSKRDTLWPEIEREEAPPPLTLQLPNSRPVTNPRIVLPRAFIQMLAAGRMNPKEAMFLLQTYEDEEDLQTYVDEDNSIALVSLDNDSSNEDSDDDSMLSTSCHYDDVSLLSAVHAACVREDSIQPMDGTSLVAIQFDSYSYNDNQNVGLQQRVQNDPNADPKKHSIVSSSSSLRPWNSVGGTENLLHGSEQNIVTNDGCSNPQLPYLKLESSITCPSHHRIINHGVFTDNSINRVDVLDPCWQPLPKKGMYCLPEEDSGLLCGSC